MADARPGVELERRLGLRRDSDPPETRAGQPLRPFTIPNIVGYLRIVALASFLTISLSSEDGRETVGTVCYGLAAGGDYLDGLLARTTGQYSRLGALMDPLLDRMVVVAGVIVTWNFDLLPRWALGALIAREALMLVIVPAALRMGLDLSINWTGRLAVWPTMMAFGMALISDSNLADLLLYVGLAGSIAASVIYVRDGRARYGELQSGSTPDGRGRRR
jgi:cardiolipin synthase